MMIIFQNFDKITVWMPIKGYLSILLLAKYKYESIFMTGIFAIPHDGKLHYILFVCSSALENRNSFFPINVQNTESLEMPAEIFVIIH